MRTAVEQMCKVSWKSLKQELGGGRGKGRDGEIHALPAGGLGSMRVRCLINQCLINCQSPCKGKGLI